MGSGTDRSTVWMITLDAVCVATVAAAVTWRVGARRGLGGVPRPAALVAAGGASAALVVALALGPLQAHPRPWNASRFTDALAGKILQDTAVTRAIVSMTGTATGRQNALVRADLLVGPQRLAATSFQLELLPSGMVCRGTVLSVRSSASTRSVGSPTAPAGTSTRPGGSSTKRRCGERSPPPPVAQLVSRTQ